MRGQIPSPITPEQLRAVGNPEVTDPEGLWRFLSLGTQRPTAAVLAAARPPDPSPEEFRRIVLAQRGGHDVDVVRKVARGRAIVAALRAQRRAELRRRVHGSSGR